MIINSARFVTSSAEVGKTPSTDRHEYAFIGRSNVGKSSLINMLTGKNGLAKTSSTPGKTMLINHFLVNDSWYIVDLPGYGYAQRSKAEIAKLDKMIRDYILYRAQMTNLFLLIDSRLEPQKIDLKFMEWLGENGVPFSIVFTKIDKMSKQKGQKAVAQYVERLLEQWEELPPIFITSSEDKRGREELLDYISQLNKLPLGGDEPTEEKIVSKEDKTSKGTATETTKETTTMEDQTKTPEEIAAEERYPGAAIDAADDDKVSKDPGKSQTCALNNNPNNDDL